MAEKRTLEKDLKNLCLDGDRRQDQMPGQVMGDFLKMRNWGAPVRLMSPVSGGLFQYTCSNLFKTLNRTKKLLRPGI